MDVKVHFNEGFLYAMRLEGNNKFFETIMTDSFDAVIDVIKYI